MDKDPRLVTRRKLLRGIGTALAVVPFSRLVACTPNDAGNGGNGGGGGTGGGAGSGGDLGGGATVDSGTAADAGAADLASSGGWATGGTGVMSGNYPDPFMGGLGSTCDLTCSQTLGPCYAKTLTRKDISEGHNGLPVRLAFLVVDSACQPVAGASVDIWHAAPEGVYSGDDAAQMCTLNDPNALQARWFRGVQTTDAKGRVDFDTCFPGWYSGRTIHIHFTVRLSGTEYVTSQLYFDDALDDEIVETQPLYDTRGARDTKNASDHIYPGSGYVFQTQRTPDGAMLAWKTLVIRSSTSTQLCRA
jgi:protocatechuate 3,4-dioxygenase beta subunit